MCPVHATNNSRALVHVRRYISLMPSAHESFVLIAEFLIVTVGVSKFHQCADGRWKRADGKCDKNFDKNGHTGGTWLRQ